VTEAITKGDGYLYKADEESSVMITQEKEDDITIDSSDESFEYIDYHS